MAVAKPNAETAASEAPDAPQGAKAQQIIEAARRVFMEQGYGAASMDAIARDAGVSKATLYAYFASKEQLFAGIIGGECRRNAQVLWTAEGDPVPSGDVRADLLDFGQKFGEFMLSERALAMYRLVVAEAQRFPEVGRIFYESGPSRILAGLAAYFEAATARGLLAVPNPRLAADQFVALVRGGAYLRPLLGVEDQTAERDPARIVESAVDVFLSAYGPGGRAAQSASAGDRTSEG